MTPPGAEGGEELAQSRFVAPVARWSRSSQSSETRGSAASSFETRDWLHFDLLASPLGKADRDARARGRTAAGAANKCGGKATRSSDSALLTRVRRLTFRSLQAHHRNIRFIADHGREQILPVRIELTAVESRVWK